jgi:hypothetical protein
MTGREVFLEDRLANEVVLGLFQGVPGARHWRRHLSEYGPRTGAGIEVVTQALEKRSAAGIDQSSAIGEDLMCTR